ncbi:response regulator transcription factor [Geobacter pelophilus]|jgi:DNA-binding NarL/FixJ family response regulator|uniref:Response regulator transcription factor n=1 Tax=Geoanaerobacter pelophilus TaxID=60036 RepID=A0AAW4L6S0_9BACT|nr:response regulator transcription factor [Geoanaerobacter pelophilus]MBT0665520.1 response regulator transcription factor [Geoanaerobacter pelophilus]
MSIKVLLVDDHKIMREGLISVLGMAEDVDVVAEASCGSEAVAKALEHLPDIVVMDLSLQDMGGIEATRRILAKRPSIKVLVLSMSLDRNCVLESLDAGARGYIAKSCAAEELVVAIRTVHAGKPYLCVDATEIIIQGFSSCLPMGQSSQLLTHREQEVLKLTAEGGNTKEIAFELGVSIKMIEVHRMHIRKKLGLKSIAQLTTYAARTGLISI